MKKFYFVRHGDTEKRNPDGTVVTSEVVIIDGERHWFAQGGGTDNSLSEIGWAQALDLASLVEEEGITNIVTSPLIRAVTTATLLQNRYIRMIVDEDLKECHYGPWEGKFAPLSVFIGKDPTTQKSENFSFAMARSLLHRLNDGTLLSGHGNGLRDITALLGIHLSKADCANAQLLCFEPKDGKWTMTNLSARRAAKLRASQ